ncbi:LysR family transcriptional regulator [Leeia oryzae]|uniref:LysR family transcriptional regulator n=1 Tax=Leeia oryzae TaxID=356662 RepID=UPI00052776EE|nr:LysR family transcriptional regulator [Leeia oryzae]
MDMLASMRVFVRVVEAGSFVKAAQQMDISNTATSRMVAELEEHLGTRLLQRTTRRLSLTEAGRSYLERCYQILADIEEAESSIRCETRQLTGTLRINAPVTFGILHLSPLISGFQATHPNLKLDVSLADRIVDLIEEGCDLALRISNQLSPTLIARRITTIHLCVCASPDYLATHGTPTTPDALQQHNCLVYTNGHNPDVWSFGSGENRKEIKVSGTLMTNNGDLLKQAAIRGEGIIMEPTFSVGDALKSGALVPLLIPYPTASLNLYAVYTSRRHLPAKARAFVDYLSDEIGETPPWDAWMWNQTTQHALPPT